MPLCHCATVPVCYNNRWGEGRGGGRHRGNQATWGNHHVNHCLPTVSIDKYYHSGDHSTAPSDHCDTRLANDSILNSTVFNHSDTKKVKLSYLPVKLYFFVIMMFCEQSVAQPSNPIYSLARLLEHKDLCKQ